MKKGFTLVELLIVVVVISILMAITFRLVGLGGEASYRNTTIQRLQKLENCLSGYFAAFGSYPPVPIYYKRNVYARSENGEQIGGEEGSLKWANVELACRAQPIAARFPYDSSYNEYLENVSKLFVSRCNSNDSQYKAYSSRKELWGGGFQPLNNPNQVSGWDSKSEWADVKIFQFGLMSFLLPRYLFMANGLEAADLESCQQWTSNNRLSSHPNTGSQFGSWQSQLKDHRLLVRVPSQAVCARWMPNLEGMVDCTGSPVFFGVKISSGYGPISTDIAAPRLDGFFFEQNRTVLDGMTVRDGWNSEFFYYSTPPYQNYRIWSAGPNGMTFPPWVSIDSLKSTSDKQTASNWMADDIMFLSN